jgi:hypothetical protein
MVLGVVEKFLVDIAALPLQQSLFTLLTPLQLLF